MLFWISFFLHQVLFSWTSLTLTRTNCWLKWTYVICGFEIGVFIYKHIYRVNIELNSVYLWLKYTCSIPVLPNPVTIYWVHVDFAHTVLILYVSVSVSPDLHFLWKQHFISSLVDLPVLQNGDLKQLLHFLLKYLIGSSVSLFLSLAKYRPLRKTCFKLTLRVLSSFSGFSSPNATEQLKMLADSWSKPATSR